MSTSPDLLQHVPSFFLVVARLGGLFLYAPLLTGTTLPRRAKILFVLAMALAIYPALSWSSAGEIPLDLIGLAPIIVGELLVGAVIGLFAVIPLMSMQLAGVLMGQQMGLNLGNIVNPAIDIQGDNLGQMLFLIAIACFLTIGGLEVMWGTLIATFDRLPPGGLALTHAPLETLIELISSGFELALRIALPVILIIFLENIAVGLIMKTVPSLNIMTFGFPIRIIVGLLVFTAGLGLIKEVIIEDLYQSLEVVMGWARSLTLQHASPQMSGS